MNGTSVSVRTLNYFIDQIIIFLISIILLVDIMNGILLFNNVHFPFSISQIYKTSILCLMIFRIYSSYRIHLRLLTFFFILCFLLIIYLHSVQHLNISYIKQDIVIALKLLLIPIAYFYFCILHSVRPHTFRKTLTRIFLFNFFVIFISMILGYFGYGVQQYSGGTGSRGYFYAGNELSGVIIVISAILTFYFWNRYNNKKYYFLFGVLLLIVVIIKATKTSILGVTLILILTPLISERKNFFKLTKFKFRFFFALLIFVPIIGYTLYLGSQQIGLIERLVYFSQKFDFVTVVLSGRNEFVLDAITILQEHYNILDVLIGKGVGPFLDHMSYFYGQPKSTEIDPFDIFFYFGILGLLVTASFWFYILIFSIHRLKNRLIKYAPSVVLLNILLLSISFTAGHIMFSGLTGIFIAFANSTLNLKICNDENSRKVSL